jgi:hypothetical protein
MNLVNQKQMLQNKHVLAKIGADASENGQCFAKSDEIIVTCHQIHQKLMMHPMLRVARLQRTGPS